jgi:ABC-type phosphate transport system substrate-binding protein
VVVTGLPKSVTAGTSSSVKKGCEVEVAGVWPIPGKVTVTFKFTVSGTTTTNTVAFTVLASPCENDAVGVGSDTITPLTDQLASDYNNTLKHRTSCSTSSTSKPYEYSWDAVNPVTGQIGDPIAEKADCPSIARPNGSSQGILQLGTFATSSSGPLCTNFARSSRARNSTDPAYAAGGIAFTAMAGDAVTWSVPAVNTAAPASLTTAQLLAIFNCTDTNWDQVGGANEPITAILPQSGSGTLSTWLAALGLTTEGPCDQPTTGLEENEGDNSILNNPGAIFIYSVGDWIAQAYNAPTCAKAGCTQSNGVICKKVPGKDQFWCNETGAGTTQGAEKLGQINGVSPFTTGSACPAGSPKNAGTPTCINASFPFQRTLYNVVPYDTATADHIPGATSPRGGLDLEGLFGASGYDCSSATAKADIAAYGFESIGSNCGATN